MTATFLDMAKQLVEGDDDAPKSKEQLGARVDPRLKAPLDEFGKRLRELGVSTYGTGGTSNAIEAILEMASYLSWYDEPERFAAELLKHRADAFARKHSRKK